MRTPVQQRGFSLLEILVAFAIAAMALGLIYQVTGNNARQVTALDQRERATLLAESLLAAYETVPAQGVNESASAAGFDWQVSSRPFPTEANRSPQAARLHELLVTVHWLDAGSDRSYALSTLRPERIALLGQKMQ